MKKLIPAAVIIIAAILFAFNGLALLIVAQKLETVEADLKSTKQELEEETKSKIAKTETDLREDIKNRGLGIKTELRGEFEEKNKEISEEIKNIGDETISLKQNKAGKDELEAIDRHSKENLAAVEQRLGSIERGLDSAKKEAAKMKNEIFDPSQIYQKVKRSVVAIEVGRGSGTGFLFGSQTQIVTAYHVVRSAPWTTALGTTVAIYPNDGQKVIMATVIKIWPELDLAVIELPVPLNAEPLMPADLTKLAVGDNVVLIGNPSERIKNSLSAGIISGLEPEYQKELNDSLRLKVIQTDAAVFYGNSGGPILNNKGEVVGVIYRGISPEVFSFNFAIPIDLVQQLIEK